MYVQILHGLFHPGGAENAHYGQKLFHKRTFITYIIQALSEQTRHTVTDNSKANFERTKTEGHFCLSHFLRLCKNTEKF